MTTPRGDDGFTLVELLVAITILGVIALPLSTAMTTGLRFIGRSDQKFNDSRSALISAAYFAGDVAAANTVVPNDASACGGGTALVSFGSRDATAGVAAPVNTEVSYVYDTSVAANQKLLRKSCVNGGAATTSTAAVSLGAAPVVTCFDTAGALKASCAAADRVKMVVTQAANLASPSDPTPAAYTFTLEGTRRPK